MINVEALAMRDEIAKELYLHLLKGCPNITEVAAKHYATNSFAAAHIFMQAKYESDKELVKQAVPKPQNERNPIGGE